MTLKEKLCEPFGGLRNVTVNELEVIADEFAIGFAVWVMETDKEYDIKSTDTVGIIKELLETYKKEKGL